MTRVTHTHAGTGKARLGRTRPGVRTGGDSSAARARASPLGPGGARVAARVLGMLWAANLRLLGIFRGKELGH